MAKHKQQIVFYLYFYVPWEKECLLMTIVNKCRQEPQIQSIKQNVQKKKLKTDND